MHLKIILFGICYCISVSDVSALGISGECIDLHDRTIAPGLHYVPGPDSCTLCVCEDGNPKWCKAVLCSPPQDCKHFRVGNSCCDFICLDDTLPKHEPTDLTADLGLRLIASAVTAILSLSLLFFLVHRLRQRKIRGRENRQLSEDERSMGYITGSLAYLPDNLGYLSGGNQHPDRRLDFPYDEPSSHYPLWKPPGNYFPRGEAPPPYEEAVAAARAEAALAAAMAAAAASTATSHSAAVVGHRTIPLNLATSGSFRLQPSVAAPPRQHRGDLEQPRRPPRLSDAPDAAIRSDAYYEDVLVGPPSCLDDVDSVNPRLAAYAPITPPPPSFVLTSPPPGPPPPLNDLNKCSGACSCSYPCLVDDADDYRSECENCKSTHGSSYYVDQEPNATSPQETMTLHRRPQDYDAEELAYYPTSLTLPTHTRRPRPLPLHGTPAASLHGARENWFSSMPESTTSSSEDEEED